jgi:hypothetical protein
VEKAAETSNTGFRWLVAFIFKAFCHVLAVLPIFYTANASGVSKYSKLFCGGFQYQFMHGWVVYGKKAAETSSHRFHMVLGIYNTLKWSVPFSLAINDGY